MFLRKSPFAAALLMGLALSPFLVPGDADAIPAFSRQHKTECSTCHTIYPELNEFGEAFLKNNYVWPGHKPAAGAETAKTEEGTGKGGKNEWAYLSGLPEQIPISLTGTADLAYDRHATDGDKLDLSVRSLRLQAGGTYREAAAFFITYNLYSQAASRVGQNQSADNVSTPANNTNVPGNNTPNLSEMFLVWRQALDTPVNLKVGRFEPKLSLWKRTNRIITVPSYASTSYKVSGLSGGSAFTIDSPEDALEVSAVVGNRLLLAGGVVDRNVRDHKDGYGHASFKIGGTDFKGDEPEIDLEKESIWDFLAITLGAFGYSGTNGFYAANAPAQNLNDFYRVGAEADVLYKRLHLKGSGAFGRDTNPSFANTASAVDSHAYAFEGEYYLGAPINLIPLFRYEYEEVNNAGTRRYIPAIAYAPLQNTRISLQYNFTDGPASINRIVFASVAFSL